MSRLIAATLAGIMVLSTGAAVAGMNVPRNAAAPPEVLRPADLTVLSEEHFDHGYRMYEHGRYHQATRAFERSLAEHPGNFHAAYLAGMSYLMRSRYADARRTFLLAVELGADRVTASNAYCGIAYSYEATRQPRMAHHQYHLACKSFRANAYAQTGATRTEYRDVVKVEAKTVRTQPQPQPQREPQPEPEPRRSFGRSSMIAQR
jgi:TolA-binding protein